jgi:hypothetical protein
VSGGAPLSAVGFRRMMGRLGEAAKMPFPVHPHMLRHACGFKLANDGQDTRALQHYLGTRTFSTRSDTPSCRPSGSRTFGRIRSPERITGNRLLPEPETEDRAWGEGAIEVGLNNPFTGGRATGNSPKTAKSKSTKTNCNYASALEKISASRTRRARKLPRLFPDNLAQSH